MISEVNKIKTSAEKVKKNGVPDVPMLFLISNGNGTGWNREEWTGFQTYYIETTGSNKFIKLDCRHYIHDIEYKRIADESKQFIKDIINRHLFEIL